MSLRDEYRSHDAMGLAELVRNGDASPSELLDVAIGLVDELDPSLGAVVYRWDDDARKLAASGAPDGPFRGVPFLLKDLYADMAGKPMSNGCRLFKDHVSDADSYLVEAYHKAGLVIFGRSASPEFGLTTTTESILHGKTRNPWNLEHTAGGSSGGAAAVVAAGIVPAAHASDGGGSIRIPASCCGLFGLKPTRARVSAGPKAGEGWSGLSCNHVVSRSVRDSAALLDATAGERPGDPYFAPPIDRPYLEELDANTGRLRIHYTTKAFNGAPVDPACVEAVERTVALCKELGHELAEATPDFDREALTFATRVIVGSNLVASVKEGVEALGRDFDAESFDPIDLVEPLAWQNARGVLSLDPSAYATAVRIVHAVGRSVASFFEGCDLLLSPTMASPPLPIGELALTHPEPRKYLENLLQSIGFTQLFNVSGSPAMSVPLHWSEQGLPIGLQFAAPFGDEATLFRLAAQLEEAAPWADRRPGVSA